MELRDSVRQRLEQYSLTQVWLRERLLLGAGVGICKQELNAILCGRQVGPKADRILAEADRILDRYHMAMLV